MLDFCFNTFLMLLCCRHCLLVLSLVFHEGYCCCFRHVILLALPLFLHYFYTLLFLTLSLLSQLFLTLLILLHYHSFHVATLFTLLFLPCYFSHIATPFMLLFLHCRLFCNFKRLLANFYYSSRTTILDPFAVLLLCFLWLVWYFPGPCHVQIGAQRLNTNSNTKCEFFCIFSNFLRFFIIVVLFSIVFVLFFLLLLLFLQFYFFQFILCCFFSLYTDFLIRVFLCFFCNFLKT